MLNPHQLAEQRLELSEEFSRYSGEIAISLKLQAEYYNAHRAEFKSDTAVKRSFEVTVEGQRLTTLKLKLKALAVRMSAIKTMLECLTEEARGLY